MSKPATWVGRMLSDVMSLPFDKMFVPMMMTLCFVIGYNTLHTTSEKTVQLELKLQHLASRDQLGNLRVKSLSSPCIFSPFC